MDKQQVWGRGEREHSASVLKQSGVFGVGLGYNYGYEMLNNLYLMERNSTQWLKDIVPSPDYGAEQEL